MSTVCELCGKTSGTDKICSHYGAKILSREEIENLPQHLSWGWATFDLISLTINEKIEALDILKQEWEELEKFTVLHLSDSQLNKFNSVEQVKVLVREDFYLGMKDKIKHFSQLFTHFQSIGYFSYAKEINELLDLEKKKKLIFTKLMILNKNG